MKKIINLLIAIFLYSSLLSQEFNIKLGNAGLEISKDIVIYDGSYREIPYPNGDVPADIGVCTDVIIRAYRKLDIDLQKEMHEDIIKNIDKYWRIDSADSNIDHRRVDNLVVFFKRFGKVLPITNNPEDYKPGDIIHWKLGGYVNHIGLVVSKKCEYSNERYLVVHNIGGGQNVEDFLFGDKIVGHYSYEK
jgi:uncharacterized protein YijF (DUF1287 family)